jgi:hypothetical protein
MSAEDAPKSAKVSQEEFITIQNRIQLALAKHENIVKSWTASSARKEPTKTQEQLDAEDAALFRNEPPYLGVGAPIPSHFLISDAERNNKTLRAKFFPGKGLKGSKPRDPEEKAASAKRVLNEESSDEEGGRSSLGKAKKVRTTKAQPAPVEEARPEVEQKVNDEETELLGVKKNESVVAKVTMISDVSACSQLSYASSYVCLTRPLATYWQPRRSHQIRAIASKKLKSKLKNLQKKQKSRDPLSIRPKSKNRTDKKKQKNKEKKKLKSHRQSQ